MTKDEALRTALGALKFNQANWQGKDAAIKACEEALETKDEPVAWDLADKVRQELDRQSCPDAFMRIAVDSIVKHYTPPQLKRDKPVAYGMRDTMIGAGNRMMYVRLDKGQDGCTVPLYTKPQAKEWVWLTDEEIDKIRSTPMSVEGGVGFSIYSYARLIEAKLKEKNGY